MKGLRHWLALERERWVLWLPVVLMAGMLLYFSLPDEPNPTSLLPLAGLPFATQFTWRRNRLIGWLFIAACLMAAGFFWAKIYTDAQAVIMLERETRIVPVQGRVIEVGDVEEGLRLVLDEVVIDGVSEAQTPQRIRVTLRGSDTPLLTGERISLRAGLLTPAGPVMPGGFDFARYFFFRGIGAVGYAIPPVTKLREAETNTFSLKVTAWRQVLSERIRSQMSDPEGAVAAALMTGDRAAIPTDINDAMRDTNLSHILSISGMHMAIISGLVFISVRLLLIVIPFTRHLRHTKKIAAALALIVSACYLVISGFPVSAVRAFVMVALMLGAVLIDREVTPMRSLMIAALMIILYNPASPLDPGFQLSFIATAALIAWYERVRLAADHAAEAEHYIRRAAIYIGGILVTSLVAELPTTLFVIYHFNSLSIYGMIANLLVSPLVTFLIMPGIILAFLLMPFGLEYWPLLGVEWGISGMMAIAQYVSSIPYAQFFIPGFPGWSMVLIAFGTLWVILWRKRVRWYGLAMVAIGLSGWATHDFPDLLISKDGKQIAGRIDGELRMLQGRAESFIPQQWANGSGVELLPVQKKNTHDHWRCDTLGCVHRYRDMIIAMPKEHEAMAKDCVKAQIIIAPFYIDEGCASATIIDRADLMQKGSHWLWLGNDIRMQSTAELQGNRPWNAHGVK
jgi:competence protein ComEC